MSQVSLPVSARQPHRLVIDGVIYLVKPATRLEKAEWRRDLARMRCHYPADAEMLAALRGALRALAPANLADLLALVDEIEAIADPLDRFARLPELKPLADLVRPFADELLRLETARQFYLDVAPLLAAARFLVGIEGGDVPYRREAEGLVAEDVLEALSDSAINQIGSKAMALFNLSEAQAKNSAAPSPSQPSPLPSAMADASTQDRPMAAPAG